MSSRIIIFGTGGFSHYLTERVRKEVEIVAYLDTVNGGVNSRTGP